MQKILGNLKDKLESKMSSPQQEPLHVEAAAVANHLTVSLKNDSTHNTVYAYITGQALDSGNKLFLLKSDGKTPYFPSSPSKTSSHLTADCAIKLGAPGSTIHTTIPHIAGGRIWFSYDHPLTFLLNPGPALVEPSVTNASDPNYHTSWGFCEFTYNPAQLFANISYVDFVALPIALTLTTSSGATKHVAGIPADGLAKVAAGLRAQEKKDGRGWGRLVVNDSAGKPLRVLSPNAGHVLEGDIFAGYYASYVDRVWAKYGAAELRVDTQASYGALTARVKGGNLVFSDGPSFAKPSSADIFSCSTGPFAGGGPSKLALIPRIAAALNRSTLLEDASQPGGSSGQFYKEAVTNHYSRVVHAENMDGRGYAFPYDDVVGKDGVESAGTVFDGKPKEFTVVVGGRNAHK